MREPCLIFEASGWAECDQGEEYLKAMFPGFTQSLHLEHGFNDTRDNECRGARHKQRSDTRLQVFMLHLAQVQGCTCLVLVALLLGLGPGQNPFDCSALATLSKTHTPRLCCMGGVALVGDFGTVTCCKVIKTNTVA